MTEKKKADRLSVRIPPIIKVIIEFLKEKGVYMDTTDFVREALRAHASKSFLEYWQLIGLVEKNNKGRKKK